MGTPAFGYTTCYHLLSKLTTLHDLGVVQDLLQLLETTYNNLKTYRNQFQRKWKGLGPNGRLLGKWN